MKAVVKHGTQRQFGTQSLYQKHTKETEKKKQQESKQIKTQTRKWMEIHAFPEKYLNCWSIFTSFSPQTLVAIQGMKSLHCLHKLPSDFIRFSRTPERCREF